MRGGDRESTGPESVVRELERRLDALQAAEDSTFGRFTPLDWAICVAGFVALPLLLFWWAA
jgi:hypothetical protein